MVFFFTFFNPCVYFLSYPSLNGYDILKKKKDGGKKQSLSDYAPELDGVPGLASSSAFLLVERLVVTGGFLLCRGR